MNRRMNRPNTAKKASGFAAGAMYEPNPQEKAVPSSPRMTMTVEEMGRELGISRATAYELSQQPDFPSFSIGRRVLISREGLMKWIEKQVSLKGAESLQTIEK